MQNVLIVLVNYNNSKDTILCLDSILKSNYSNYSIVVADNYSNDNSFSNLKEWSLKFNSVQIKDTEINLLNNIWIIKTPSNGGFAYGNNYAIKYANHNSISYEYVWLLNNDTIINVDTLTHFVNRMNCEVNNSSNVGIIGGKLYHYQNHSIFQGIGGVYNKYLAASRSIGSNEIDVGQYDSEQVPSFDYVIGASMFVRKEFINEVGLMNEDYFLYFEELDWVLRGRKYGWEIGYEYRAKVFHKEGGTTKQSNIISEIADKYQVRNRLVFTYKYYKPFLITVIPIIYVSVINRLLRGQYSRALYIFKTINRTIFNLKEISYGKKD